MTTGDKEAGETDTVVKWLYPGAQQGAEDSQSPSQGDTTDMDSELATDQSINGSELGEKSSPSITGSEAELPNLGEEVGRQVAAASSYVGSFFNPAAGASFLSSIGKASGLTKSSPTEAVVSEESESSNAAASGSIFSSAFSKMGGISKMATSLTMDNISGKVAAVAGATYPDTPPNEEVEPEANKDSKDEAAWGYSSFTSAFSKATKAASDYSKVLQDSVNKAPLMAEFNQEQQNFINSKGDKEIPSAPWSGYQNEEELREKILALSEDRRNFLRAPPSGVNFDFEYSGVAAHALVLLQEDTNLKQLRYELVPKKIKEDDFWRNYFYRVGLLKQSFELSNNMPADAVNTSRPPINPVVSDEELPASGDQDDEFVSELHQASSKDIKEADEAMKKLGLGKNDAEWEAELEGELNEYEMVGEEGEADANAEDNPEWENQIQEMLDAEAKK